ncbi:MAG: hypothetical protein A2017_11330 [Lentisphaerae bacterium GWF2_44_16]|nr:MAG: hypothetical protein A2017_11330 [Lentisphaerae bacterium GWF2_44_16]
MDIRSNPGEDAELCLEVAGPEKEIFFDPENTKAAILTCGGLCPGLNDVIRGIVYFLDDWYSVNDVIGIRYGYNGLSSNPFSPPVQLTKEYVSDIHMSGGTILGSSRGNPPVSLMVDNLLNMGIDMLFCVGGDGTLRGAHEIAKEIIKRNLNISVIGIPKTIDNDVPFVYRSFGFRTAVAMARDALECAHIEAKGAFNGVGIVKIMGREAGFLTARSVCASGDVDYCLIPEMEFPLHGKGGLLEHLRRHLKKHGHHALIAVAEGAGRHLIGDTGEKDASGNVRFNDIGKFLKDEISKAFDSWNEVVNVKYIDPSYLVRSIPANSEDNIYCADLARYAIDAAMSGKTDMMIGYWHGTFVNIPFGAIGSKKRMTGDCKLWMAVLSSTEQPIDWW